MMKLPYIILAKSNRSVTGKRQRDTTFEINSLTFDLCEPHHFCVPEPEYIDEYWLKSKPTNTSQIEASYIDEQWLNGKSLTALSGPIGLDDEEPRYLDDEWAKRDQNLKHKMPCMLL
jgi:hypothetical protein